MEEKTILISQQAGVINTNFEDLKTDIAAQMQIYEELEVTEDNKTERKKDIATLRKIHKALNDKKIEVKNEFMKPYMAFESQVKELQELVGRPIMLLDSQVKEFEEKQRLERIEYIKGIYLELIGDLSDKIVLDSFYNSKWENLSASKKAVKEELTAKIADIKRDISTISSMQSDKTEEALLMYYNNLDLAAAIKHINRYEQQKREWELKEQEKRKREQELEVEKERERIRREERERIRREEELKKQAQNEVLEQVQQQQTQEREVMAVQKQTSSVTYATYTVEATEEELRQIEMYFNSLGIEFERVN